MTTPPQAARPARPQVPVARRGIGARLAASVLFAVLCWGAVRLASPADAVVTVPVRPYFRERVAVVGQVPSVTVTVRGRGRDVLALRRTPPIVSPMVWSVGAEADSSLNTVRLVLNPKEDIELPETAGGLSVQDVRPRVVTLRVAALP